MQPLQRLYDRFGNEVCLFPLEYMNVSNPEHQELAIDFLGWDSHGRVYNCQCYAPFTGEVHSLGNSHSMIYWSSQRVRFVDGSLDYITILVAHSETAPPPVGTQIIQGQNWYHTGNYASGGDVSHGDHLHFEIARGHVSWDQSGTHLENPEHLYNVVAVNDTVIVDGEGYDWKEYEGQITPTINERKRFNWPVFTNKIRKRRLQ